MHYRSIVIKMQAPKKFTQVFTASLVGKLSIQWINPGNYRGSPVHGEYKHL